ncbi:hypothetical protein AVEN_222141-1 [Araneus ventricosus]|uniref:Uncharacterized protein n=1 Tax=Araneus ventricosus TaxID=182803 RepID=A0A4Y2IKH4_ARAVE|nr:hypothetical protein AVEN_222141-1 [Araneus ventricosus]
MSSILLKTTDTSGMTTKVVKPSLATIQADTRLACCISSYRCPSLADSAINVATDKLVRWYSETAEVAFPTCPKHALLEQDLVTWQAMEGHFIYPCKHRCESRAVYDGELLINGTWATR